MSYNQFDPEDNADFDDGYDGQYSDGPAEFIWQTQEGQLLTPDEMETSHIFNCVRMIFNHTAPEEMKLKPFKHWPGWHSVPAPQKRVCIMTFISELSRRHDLAPTQLTQLRHMASCAREAWPEASQIALPRIQ